MKLVYALGAMPPTSKYARPRRLDVEPLERRDMMAAAPEALLHYAGDIALAPGHSFVASGAQWPQPGGPGSPLTIMYSVTNLADGGLPGGLGDAQLHAAIEEALGLWAQFAPLDFVEIADSGPPPDDIEYPPAAHPQIRIGHHYIDGDLAPDVLAHAYYPPHPEFTDGLNGDVHFDNGNTWTLDPDTGVDILEVLTHELGHSLGLGHEEIVTAIMNPYYGGRFDGLGTAFLFADDIAGIRAIYGTGVGSVTPLVEMAILGSGLEIADGDLAASVADGTDFGRVILGGGFVERTFTIANQGRGALQLIGSPRVAITGPNAADFSIAAPPAASVAPQASTTFTVRFTPSVTGSRTAIVSIASTDRDESPYTFTLAGRGRSPVQEIDLVSSTGRAIASGDLTPTVNDGTDFGFANVVGGAVTRTFTIVNDGALPLSLTGQPLVIVSGANAGDFTVAAPPQTPVLADGSATLTVRFDPSAAGVRTAIISIASDDLDEANYLFAVQGTGYATSAEIGLFGNGTAIADGDTTPSILDHTAFGSVNAAGGALTRTFTITNTGTGPLHLTGEPRVAVTGPGTADFRVVEAPATPIAPGGNTTFRIEFDPTVAGTRSAGVVIANTDSNENPYEFSVSGSGFVLAPDIQITGGSVPIASGDATPAAADNTDFGAMPVAGVPIERTYSISNTGTSALRLIGNPPVALLGPHADEFEVLPPGMDEIPVGGSTTFTVRFVARGAGTRSATIVIPCNDPDEDPFTFAVNGVGIVPSQPPRVTGVGIKSTTGNHTGGTIATGSGHLQLRPLPWINLDQVEITFDHSVIVGEDDLTLRGATVADYVFAGQSFVYDDATNTARWTLSAPLSADTLSIELVSFDGSRGVRASDGAPLDGEWLNPTAYDEAPAGMYPSGDGTPGGDFQFHFHVLPGDVAATTSGGLAEVDAEDFRFLLDRQFLSALDAAYQATADLDGDGAINILDLARLRDRLGQRLPDSEPPSALAVGASWTTLSHRHRAPLLLHATRRSGLDHHPAEREPAVRILLSSMGRRGEGAGTAAQGRHLRRP